MYELNSPFDNDTLDFIATSTRFLAKFHVFEARSAKEFERYNSP